jgi:hypothetical protein
LERQISHVFTSQKHLSVFFFSIFNPNIRVCCSARDTVFCNLLTQCCYLNYPMLLCDWKKNKIRHYFETYQKFRHEASFSCVWKIRKKGFQESRTKRCTLYEYGNRHGHVCAVCRIVSEWVSDGEERIYASRFKQKPAHSIHLFFYSVELNHWIAFQSHILHIRIYEYRMIRNECTKQEIKSLRWELK